MNRILLLPLLVGCRDLRPEPTAHIAAARRPHSPEFVRRPDALAALPHGRIAADAALHDGALRLAEAHARPAPEDGLMSQIGASIRGVSVGGGGEALTARLDEEDPMDVRTWGAALVPFDELFGDGETEGLCENAEMLYEFEEDGEDYEASLSVEPYFLLVGPPEVTFTDLDSDCADALLASAGDIDAALDDDCDEYDEAQFFPTDSTCRTCIQDNAGDYAGCVDDGECEEQSTYKTWVQYEDGQIVWWDEAFTYLWACAPDYLLPAAVLGHFEADGTMPRAFDHPNWGHVLFPAYNDEAGEVGWLAPQGYDDPDRGDTLGEGALFRLNYLRPAGDTDTPHKDRMAYASSIRFDTGARITNFWAFSGGIGVISRANEIPDGDADGDIDAEDPYWGFIYDGMGLDPYALRPDGTDETSIDDTFARDYLAADTMKTATTINGILISLSNRNRCTDWTGPDADGAYACAAMGTPEAGWLSDGEHTWTEVGGANSYAWPMVTLGSTGLPDPDVPGGLALHIAGTPALENPDWEDCSWPHQIVPDAIPIEDVPGDWGGPASFDGSAYRFGKDEDQDIRLVLATNQLRGFCPEDADFGEEDR